MSNERKMIENLLKETGKNAPAMTSALKNVGGGSMEHGLSRIGTYFYGEITKGRIEGVVGGVIGGVIGFEVIKYFVKKGTAKYRQHKEEGKAVLDDFKNGINEFEENSSDEDDRLEGVEE